MEPKPGKVAGYGKGGLRKSPTGYPIPDLADEDDQLSLHEMFAEAAVPAATVALFGEFDPIDAKKAGVIRKLAKAASRCIVVDVGKSGLSDEVCSRLFDMSFPDIEKKVERTRADGYDVSAIDELVGDHDASVTVVRPPGERMAGSTNLTTSDVESGDLKFGESKLAAAMKSGDAAAIKQLVDPHAATDASGLSDVTTDVVGEGIMGVTAGPSGPDNHSGSRSPWSAFMDVGFGDDKDPTSDDPHEDRGMEGSRESLRRIGP